MKLESFLFIAMALGLTIGSSCSSTLPCSNNCIGAKSDGGADAGVDGRPDEGSLVDGGAGHECASSASNCKAQRKLSSGYFHTCLVTSSGGVKCWGSNVYGKIGAGKFEPPSLAPQSVVGLTSGVAQVACGGDFSCARLNDGNVKCWGLGTFGQLGNAEFGELNNAGASPTPVSVLLPKPATQITAGETHACARLNDGQVACWGSNQYGELGHMNGKASFTPVLLPNVSDAVQVAAGGLHTCVLKASGGVLCWGFNMYGQLGSGTLSGTSGEVVGGTKDMTSLAPGGIHTCALHTSGEVSCWGSNNIGQGGYGINTKSASAPTKVSGIVNVSQVAAGATHTCVGTASGETWCWGKNSHGQLGIGEPEVSFTPVKVMNLARTVEISAGFDHTCARLADDDVRCWGSNEYGQLGTDTKQNSSTPIPVPL